MSNHPANDPDPVTTASMAVPVARAIVLADVDSIASSPPLSRAAAWFDVSCAFASVCAGFMIAAAGQIGGWWNPPDAWVIPSHVLLNGGVVLTVVAVLLRRRGESVAAVGLQRAPLGVTLGWGLLAIPACYLANFGLVMAYLCWMFVRGVPLEQGLESKMQVLEVVSQTPTWLVLPVTLFVGLYEEVLFRGLILSRLRVALGSAPAAVILSAILFGAMHFSHGLLGAMQAGVIGLVFAVMTLWRRSLWPAIVAHFVMDAGAFLLSGVLRDAMSQLKP